MPHGAEGVLAAAVVEGAVVVGAVVGGGGELVGGLVVVAGTVGVIDSVIVSIGLTASANVARTVVDPFRVTVQVGPLVVVHPLHPLKTNGLVAPAVNVTVRPAGNRPVHGPLLQDTAPLTLPVPDTETVRVTCWLVVGPPAPPGAPPAPAAPEVVALEAAAVVDGAGAAAAAAVPDSEGTRVLADPVGSVSSPRLSCQAATMAMSSSMTVAAANGSSHRSRARRADGGGVGAGRSGSGAGTRAVGAVNGRPGAAPGGGVSGPVARRPGKGVGACGG